MPKKKKKLKKVKIKKKSVKLKTSKLPKNKNEVAIKKSSGANQDEKPIIKK